MAECFCGCGRKVKFRRRRINGIGAATVTLVGKLEETADDLERRAPLAPGFDNNGLVTGWRQRALEGRRLAETLQAEVHDGGSATSTDFEREWAAWGDESLGFDESMRGILALPDEEAAQFLHELREATKGWTATPAR